LTGYTLTSGTTTADSGYTVGATVNLKELITKAGVTYETNSSDAQGTQGNPGIISLYACWQAETTNASSYNVTIPADVTADSWAPVGDTGKKQAKIGTISATITDFKTNSRLTISVSSKNARLVIEGGTASIPVIYSLSDGSVDSTSQAKSGFELDSTADRWSYTATLAKGTGEGTTTGDSSGSSSTSYFWEKQLTATVDDSAAVYAGTYSDTLTFKVSLSE
jgi:hypothetical protein